MNDRQNKEKISPTYKKYAKYIGKLFWERHNEYQYETGQYVTRWNLIMVHGLARRWGRGHYMYAVSDLSATDWRQNYNIEASRFNLLLFRKNMVPVDPKNPNPPPTENK